MVWERTCRRNKGFEGPCKLLLQRGEFEVFDSETCLCLCISPRCGQTPSCESWLRFYCHLLSLQRVL